MALLEVDRLQVAYGQVIAVWEVSLTVDSGQVVAIVGPNGAGKSSLINAISGLVPAQGGLVFAGRNLTGVPAYRRTALGLSQCPEGRKLFPDMTVEENLLLGAYTCADRAEVSRRYAEVVALFPRLGERRNQIAHTLSGGEQQMAALGRALMAKPRLLLLDEPSLGLAPKIVSEVFRSIQRVRNQGTPILIVEQNVRQTLELADHAYVLENGRIAQSGAGGELLGHEHIRQTYLGLKA
ncbi:MAG: ABC transporter ATP-binding protein [Gammaproteobacteria bacterium]